MGLAACNRRSNPAAASRSPSFSARSAWCFNYHGFSVTSGIALFLLYLSVCRLQQAASRSKQLFTKLNHAVGLVIQVDGGVY